MATSALWAAADTTDGTVEFTSNPTYDIPITSHDLLVNGHNYENIPDLTITIISENSPRFMSASVGVAVVSIIIQLGDGITCHAIILVQVETGRALRP